MQYFFITGTSSGLGKAITELLLQQQNIVVYGFGRHCIIKHRNYFHTKTDLSQQEQLADFTFEDYDVSYAEKIVLINNAGVIEPVKYIGETQAEEIIRNFTVNLIAPAVLSNQFIQMFAENNAEKIIVNISSGAAHRPVDGWASYCSSKAGLDMFSRTVALEREIRKNSLKIVSIAPGIVDTPMQKTIRQNSAKDFSRIAEFKAFKKDTLLTMPEVAAKKILSAIQNLQDQNNVVFSVKE